jgi:hypothetical protein
MHSAPFGGAMRQVGGTWTHYPITVDDIIQSMAQALGIKAIACATVKSFALFPSFLRDQSE